MSPAPSVPNSRVYLGSAFSLPGNASTRIPLDTASYDPYSIWDLTTNHRATPNVPGLYQVSWNVTMELENSPMVAWSFVKVTGTEWSQSDQVDVGGNANDSWGFHGSDLLRFNGLTDYLELFGGVIGGNAQPLFANSQNTYISTLWVAP